MTIVYSYLFTCAISKWKHTYPHQECICKITFVTDPDNGFNMLCQIKKLEWLNICCHPTHVNIVMKFIKMNTYHFILKLICLFFSTTNHFYLFVPCFCCRRRSIWIFESFTHSLNWNYVNVFTKLLTNCRYLFLLSYELLFSSYEFRKNLCENQNNRQSLLKNEQNCSSSFFFCFVSIILETLSDLYYR